MKIKSSACPICGSTSLALIEKSYPGYQQKSRYVLHECNHCDTRFAQGAASNADDYNEVYEVKGLGYDRYARYAKSIKSQRNPMEFLSQQEPAYYSLYHFLRGKRKLQILEVASGFGYTTYALSRAGHKVLGVDISREAVDFAKQHFGNNYLVADIYEYAQDCKDKYDLIYASELVEHLDDPLSFVNACKKLLAKDGAILLTTPDKNFYVRKQIWRTDPPPIHLFWFSEKSFEVMASRTGLQSRFLRYYRYKPHVENRAATFLYKLTTDVHNVLGYRHDLSQSTAPSQPSFAQRFINHSMIRSVSNFFARMGRTQHIAVVLRQSNR